MSEYTPSTEEVRDAYVRHCERQEWYERDFAEIAKEFDRWLTEHDAEVAKAERERIIGLLETRLDDCHDKNDMGGWSFMPELFIALIKEAPNE